METLKPKRVCESQTEHVEILMPGHINGFKRLFGGQLMEWIDIVAAVVARRHSNCNVTTACVDNLQFKAAAYANNTLVIKGKITYVGSTSMEIRVDSFVEALNGEQNVINHAYLVLVALDEHDNPAKVPPLLIETDEEKAEWEAGLKRHNLRKQRRAEDF